MKRINVYQPRFCGLEREYVVDCIESTWISSKGKYIALFEEQFAKYVGCKFGTSVMNGTVALHLGLLSLGITDEDEVIVPTFTYIASVNAIKYVSAVPVFCDSKIDSWQMDPDDVERKITSKTKAIMAVHLYGHPCEMDRLREIADKHSLYLIEDCAEAIGSEYKGHKVGSFGDVACFSFFGNKNITTGEGGMVLTNNEEIYKRAANLKTQGISYTKEYWHDYIGYNFRMTNIQAAIGVAQLTMIDKNIKDKAIVFEKYKEGLSGLPISMLDRVGEVKNTYWMCCIQVEDEKVRDDLRKYLDLKGIETRPTFYSCHNLGLFGYNSEYPNADYLSVRGINLPSYPDLTDEQIDYICNSIREYYESNNALDM